MEGTSQENVDDIEAIRRERRRKRILENAENRIKSLANCTRDIELTPPETVVSERSAQEDDKSPVSTEKNSGILFNSSDERKGKGKGSESKTEEEVRLSAPVIAQCGADGGHVRKTSFEPSVTESVHFPRREGNTPLHNLEIRQRTAISNRIVPSQMNSPDPLETSEPSPNAPSPTETQPSHIDDKLRRFFPAVIAILLQTLRLLGVVESAFYPVTLEVFLLTELGLMLFDWSQSAWKSPVSQAILQYAFVLLHISPSLSERLLQSVLILNRILRDFSIYFVVSLLYEETLISEST